MKKILLIVLILFIMPSYVQASSVNSELIEAAKSIGVSFGD